jgi:hypothetical protein
VIHIKDLHESVQSFLKKKYASIYKMSIRRSKLYRCDNLGGMWLPIFITTNHLAFLKHCIKTREIASTVDDPTNELDVWFALLKEFISKNHQVDCADDILEEETV